MRTVTARGTALDTAPLSGMASTCSGFIVKPYQIGTQVTVTSPNLAVASVQLVNANDPCGAKYRVVYQGSGSATILVTTSGGDLKTMPVTVKPAALVA